MSPGDTLTEDSRLGSPVTEPYYDVEIKQIESFIDYTTNNVYLRTWNGTPTQTRVNFTIIVDSNAPNGFYVIKVDYKFHYGAGSYTTIHTLTINLTICEAETVSTPNTLSGPSSGKVGQNLSFSTDGSTSNLGHSVEYQFDWDDGTQSSWGAAARSHSYSSSGTKYVKARARC